MGWRRVVAVVAIYAFLLGSAGAIKLAKESDYTDIRKEVQQLVRKTNCGPILIRLSWHDAGTYNAQDGTGGPRGVMRFGTGGEATHDANNGLQIARDLLQPIHEKYPNVSTADLWSLAAVVAIEEMGGPSVAWRPGRRDASAAEESVEQGRLPDAQQGCAHLRQIFNRMGFNDQEIVALSGAHTVGRMHPDRSLHEGAWTTRPYHFDNAYFTDLVNTKFEKYTNEFGNIQYKSADDTFLAPSDYALIEDPSTLQWVQLYAKDQQRFFQDFASAFTKLQELGVDFSKAETFSCDAHLEE